MRCSSALRRYFIQQYSGHYRQCAENQHYDDEFHRCFHSLGELREGSGDVIRKRKQEGQRSHQEQANQSEDNQQQHIRIPQTFGKTP